MLYSLKVQGLRVQYFLADIFVFGLTSIVVAYLKFASDVSVININAYLITIILLGILYLGLLYLGGNYEPNAVMDFKWSIYLRAITYTAAIFFVTSFYIRTISYSRMYFTILFLFNFVAAVSAHKILNKIHGKLFYEELKYPMVAVGFEKSELGTLKKTADILGLRIIAELDSKSIIAEFISLKQNLIHAKESKDKDDIGILLYEEGDSEFKDLVSFCEINYIPLYILPSSTRMLSVPLQALDHKGLVIFGPKDLIVDGVSKRLKRTVDVILASVGIILSSWLMVLVWTIIKISSKGPGIYAQERLGLDGKTIRIYKFRTMVINSDQMLKELLHDEETRKSYYDSYKLENDPRITKIGRYLRKLSLDELPQLWNIFCGDISFVGPRPIIPRRSIVTGQTEN
ncbi:sugar transferase [Desulfitobacterium sp. Sab5]|uniref:sugar transferase n=1 Tax=Desulfitobacterium nosdiversum TaxID=3375356 RepID=UPI003CED4718